MQQRMQQRAEAAAATPNANGATAGAAAAPAANAAPRRSLSVASGTGLSALPVPSAAPAVPAAAAATAAGMARAPLSLYPFPSSAFAAAAPMPMAMAMPAPVPAIAATGVVPSPSLPASASTSAHHAALICNTCSRAPAKTSSANAATGQIVQAVTLARCSGCRAVYCHHTRARMCTRGCRWGLYLAPHASAKSPASSLTRAIFRLSLRCLPPPALRLQQELSEARLAETQVSVSVRAHHGSARTDVP